MSLSHLKTWSPTPGRKETASPINLPHDIAGSLVHSPKLYLSHCTESHRKPPKHQGAGATEHLSCSSTLATHHVALSHHSGPAFKICLITSVVKGYWTRKTNHAMLDAFLITEESAFGTIVFVPQHFSEPQIRKWAVSLWPLIKKDYWQSRNGCKLSFLCWINMKPFLKYQLFQQKSWAADIAS